MPGRVQSPKKCHHCEGPLTRDSLLQLEKLKFLCSCSHIKIYEVKEFLWTSTNSVLPLAENTLAQLRGLIQPPNRSYRYLCKVNLRTGNEACSQTSSYCLGSLAWRVTPRVIPSLQINTNRNHLLILFLGCNPKTENNHHIARSWKWSTTLHLYFVRSVLQPGVLKTYVLNQQLIPYNSLKTCKMHWLCQASWDEQ